MITMTANLQPSKTISIHVIILIVVITNCLISQSNSISISNSQNIQTFYHPSPPAPPSRLRLPDIPTTTVGSINRKAASSSSASVVIGVAAALASSTVLVILSAIAILFFWHPNREKTAASMVTTTTTTTNNNHNVKEIVIVDENGLDVLYWKKILQEEYFDVDDYHFKKQYTTSSNYNKGAEEEKRMDVTISSNNNVLLLQQQVPPLPRGKSSSSQSPVLGEKEPTPLLVSQSRSIINTNNNDDDDVAQLNSSIQYTPLVRLSVSEAVAVEVEGKMSPTPPPPPPPPSMAVSKRSTVPPPPSPPLPPPPGLAVPKGSTVAPPPSPQPPPPPSLAVSKRSIVPPPPSPPLPPPPGLAVPKGSRVAPPPPGLAIPKGSTVAPPPSPPLPPPPGLAVPKRSNVPPPPSPPLPPPPGLAVPKRSNVPPPPSPPLPPPPGLAVPKGSSVLPPPQPTTTTKRSSAFGVRKEDTWSSSRSKDNGHVKFKPLHWDKLTPNVQDSMVWDKLHKGSFKFDGDLMEALFGYVATDKNSPQKATKSTSPPGIVKSQIFILDTRKSQNIAIVLKSIGISRGKIINALVEGPCDLNEDTIEKLTRIAPTEDEATEILAFDGDPTKLADAESFLFYLLKSVPTAFVRFKMMLFRTTYALEVSHVNESLKSIESACNELRTRGLFVKLLEAVLKAGNRLNAGTSRGNAQAFDLTALRKLSDVKSSDGKTTLLLFVVQEVVRAEGKRCVLNNKNRNLSRTSSPSSSSSSTRDNMTKSKDDNESEYMLLGLPVIGGVSADFMNVKRAALFDHNLLVKTISDLSEQMVEIQRALADNKCEGHGGFLRDMEVFVDAAEQEIQALKEEQTRAMALVKKTLDYYNQGFKSEDKGENPLQLFVTVKDFLRMVDQACIDIARDIQKKTKSTSSAAIRFPKLSENFVSSSSSSDSDDYNESDIR